MNITNEKLYEIIVEIKSQQTEMKVAQSDLKSEIVAVKMAQSELRADITKWGVALFIGSIVAMTSIIGIFLASVVLTMA